MRGHRVDIPNRFPVSRDTGTSENLQHDSCALFFPPRRCDSGNLNGHYYNGPYHAMTDDGVVWYTWHGWWYSIKSVVMMVRAADLQHPTDEPGVEEQRVFP